MLRIHFVGVRKRFVVRFARLSPVVRPCVFLRGESIGLCAPLIVLDAHLTRKVRGSPARDMGLIMRLMRPYRPLCGVYRAQYAV